MNFYEKFLSLCNKVGKTPSRIAIENQISKAAVWRWKSGSMPNISTIKKLADYFGVSVEFFKPNTVNKTNNVTISPSNETADFYDRYVQLCVQKGVTPSGAAIQIGIVKTAVSNWKARKTMPTDANLQKIANYFGVSTEYLLTGKEKTATQMDDSLSAEFTALYSRLDETHQAAVLSLIKSLLDNQ